MARSKARPKRPQLPIPVWVAIISSGALIVVALVQFVIAPILSRQRPESSTVHPATKEQERATSLAARPNQQAPKLSAATRRANFQILASPKVEGGVQVFRGEPISIALVDANIKDVILVMGELTGVNFSIAPQVMGTVTVHVENTPWDAVLADVLAQNRLQYKIQGDIVQITPQ